MSQSKETPKKTDHENENQSNGEKTDTSENRKLQIKLAQLDAYIQVHLWTIFGAITAAVALLVFGYELILATYPQVSMKTLVGIIFLLLAFGLTIVAATIVPKLRTCLEELDNLG